MGRRNESRKWGSWGVCKQKQQGGTIEMLILSLVAALSFLTYLGCMVADKPCHCQLPLAMEVCLFFLGACARFVHNHQQQPSCTLGRSNVTRKCRRVLSDFLWKIGFESRKNLHWGESLRTTYIRLIGGHRYRGFYGIMIRTLY